MKLTLPIQTLKDALQKVSKGIPKSSSLPILNGIHAVVDKDSDDAIILTTSDSSNTFQVCIKKTEDIEIISNGAQVWSPKMTDIISKLSGETVTIEGNDRYHSKIKAGKSVFELAGADPEEYPKFPKLDSEHSIKMPFSEFQGLINKTAFAAAKTDTRPILKAVLWDISTEGLIVTSTDSHRMGRVYKKGAYGFEGKFPVEAKELKEKITKVFGDGDVEIFVSGTQFCIKDKHVTVFTRLLEGNYPDVSRLIPNEFSTQLTLNRKELVESLQRMMLLVNSEGKSAVTMEPSGMGILLKSTTVDIGSVQEELFYSELDGDEFQKIAFSPKYLQEAVQAMESDEVTFCLQGPMKPFLVVPKDSEENKQLREVQLILPVRTY